MAKEKTEIATTANKPIAEPINTSLSQWTERMITTVEKEYAICGVPFNEYERLCGLNAMTAIFQLVKSSGLGIGAGGVDVSNVQEIVKFCASNRLNCNAVPSECYFKIVNKKIGNDWVKTVECNMMGAGYESQLRQFGVGVEEVYPTWIVKEGDDFIYPRFKGIEITPPEWESKGLSQKTVRVVIPIKMKDGKVLYKIAEREDVKVNLIAHIRNNLMNETFGIAESRFKATQKQKDEIDKKKAEIIDTVKACATLEEMLGCAIAQPYISMAWLDSPESMITRKMINNASKSVPKDMNQVAKSSYREVVDSTYREVQDEIAENANQVDFAEVIEAEAVEVTE